MMNKEVVICSPVRTAIGTYGGTLKDTPAADLGAVAIRATLERAKLPSGNLLSEDIVNVEGGAFAHGHPIGASGAVLTTRILHSMQRDGIKRGIVTLCIGGGQGIALALETLG